MTERPEDSGVFLVLDLETTGLDHEANQIIEVAAVLLDSRLSHEFFEFSQPISVSPCELDDLIPAVREMHEASGLLDDIASDRAVALIDAERALLELIERYVDNDTTVYLSGSGVSHFDIRFINEQMPSLAERFHYAICDAGVMRRFYRAQTGADLTDANTHKTHRALDDVRCHIEELREFRDVFLAHQDPEVVLKWA